MRRRDDEKWLALIKDQMAGSLSINAFCEEHGICRSQFYKMKRLLVYPPPSKHATAFVKVERPIQSNTLSTTIQITHQQCRIDLPLSVTPDWLANLVKALS